MIKKISFITIIFILSFIKVFGTEKNFDSWVKDFKIQAIDSGISKNVVEDIMSEVRFYQRL